MQQVSEARLAIGQRIEIRGADSEWLASRIEDLTADGVTVVWPTDASRRFIVLHQGDTVEIAGSAPNDAVYSASAAVISVSNTEVPLVGLKVNGPWQRLQRRGAVRIGVAIRPRVAAKLFGDAYKDVRLGITNLSATGVQVRSQDQLLPGDLLDLAFELMGVEGELELLARVRRVQHLERVWDAGCEFESLPDRLARRIVQFVFAQQRAVARAKRG